MRNHLSSNAEPDESAALFIAALVLTLFGILSVNEAAGWVMTATLFILVAAAAGSGLVRRHLRQLRGYRVVRARVGWESVRSIGQVTLAVFLTAQFKEICDAGTIPFLTALVAGAIAVLIALSLNRPTHSLSWSSSLACSNSKATCSSQSFRAIAPGIILLAVVVGGTSPA